jgi:SAM-dependent methyltransferase
MGNNVTATRTTEGRSCALCGSSSGSFSQQASLGPWKYLRCQKCGLVFLDPAPSDEQLRVYYNGEYSPSPEHLGQSAALWTPGILKSLNEALPARGKLLEIGSSFGFFLAAAQRDGWSVTGVEMSEAASRHAREKLGVQVFSGSLQDQTQLLGQQFDAVVLFHVIEHLPAPKEFLDLCYRLTKPGGVLILKTPNISSVIARMAGSGWEWLIAPAHLYLYSPSTIKVLMEEAGYRDVRTSTVQGDARNNLFELGCSVVRKTVFTSSDSGRVVPPQCKNVATKWYHKLPSTLIELIYTPFRVTLDPWLGRRGLQPELRAIARKA